MRNERGCGSRCIAFCADEGEAEESRRNIEDSFARPLADNFRGGFTCTGCGIRISILSA